jgi:O-succinylbenzoic acid--CoA ligase
MIINLFFFSRIDNVNSGEFKWFREQIEEKLSHGWIHSDFVGGIADAVFGEKLVLVIEGEKHYWMSIYTLTSIKSQKKFFYIDKFIETENGK